MVMVSSSTIPYRCRRRRRSSSSFVVVSRRLVDLAGRKDPKVQRSKWKVFMFWREAKIQVEGFRVFWREGKFQVEGFHVLYNTDQNPKSNNDGDGDGRRRHPYLWHLHRLPIQPAMKSSAIVFLWSIFILACSDPGFAYSPQPVGSRSSLTSCRRRGRDVSLQPCHSPLQYQQQQQQQQQQNHRIDYVRSWGILSAQTRDVNGADVRPLSGATSVSGSGQSEFVSAAASGVQ